MIINKHDNSQNSNNVDLNDSNQETIPSPQEVVEWFFECQSAFERLIGDGVEKPTIDLLYFTPSTWSHYQDRLHRDIGSVPVIALDEVKNFFKNQIISDRSNLRNSTVQQLTIEQIDEKKGINQVIGRTFSRNKNFLNLVMLFDNIFKPLPQNHLYFGLRGFYAELSLKERFQFITFHELSHVAQHHQQLQKDINHPLYGVRENFRTHQSSEASHRLLHSYVHYKKISNSIKHRDKFDHYFEKEKLTPAQLIGFFKFQDLFKTLQKEMYADCAATLITASSGMTPTYDDGIGDIMNYIGILGNCRHNTISESVLFNIDQALETTDISHTTTLALERLKIIIAQRKIEPSELHYEDIHNLAQEAMVYGMTHFLKEACLACPQYETFLNALSVRQNEASLFDQHPFQNYKAKDLFNEMLTPFDIELSDSKYHLARLLGESLKENVPALDLQAYFSQNPSHHAHLNLTHEMLVKFKQDQDEMRALASDTTQNKFKSIAQYHQHMALQCAEKIISFKKNMILRNKKTLRPYLSYDENYQPHARDTRVMSQAFIFDKISHHRQENSGDVSLAIANIQNSQDRQNKSPTISAP